MKIVNFVVFKLPCQGKKILSRIFAPVNLFQKSNMVVAEEKCFLSGVVEGKNLMSLFSTLAQCELEFQVSQHSVTYLIIWEAKFLLNKA